MRYMVWVSELFSYSSSRNLISLVPRSDVALDRLSYPLWSRDSPAQSRQAGNGHPAPHRGSQLGCGVYASPLVFCDAVNPVFLQAWAALAQYSVGCEWRTSTGYAGIMGPGYCFWNDMVEAS